MWNADLQTDWNSLLHAGSNGRSDDGVSRRDFVRTALGVGFAAAAGPVMAQTAIHTDSDGLLVGDVMIESGVQKIPVYRAQPKGKTELPVVLVVSEIFGVHEYIADVARRFAHQGYLALAPDLFVRQGDPMAYGTIADVMSNIIAKVPDAQVLQDLDACRAWAAANGGKAGHVGITGFCWGGRIVWLYCAHAPVQAGVAWYGRLVGSTGPLTPRNPIDIAKSLKAPVLGLYGGKDPGISQESIAEMRKTLAEGDRAAKASEIVVYPDAGHGFHADYRPSYNAEAAKDGWKRALAWLEKNEVVALEAQFPPQDGACASLPGLLGPAPSEG
ncbi:putative carboxymethylenebutenolidase [Thiomonas sp. X19]|uniref:dienelactone hydrolase family protein n=1 Tax=Thiomonas sp. X19 TaxID=1050370 RepID=UPI000B70FE7E|nr:dienelactone hydrolase family protein [Thiomonas sp. X19]SCC93284.1 putative carboxymethylenebutenolidase [Thiomonas sp. X19]